MLSQAQPSIRLLPADVQSGITSSIAILSLNDVVVGLLENSLDARPENVDIEVDFQRGYCIVRDDGCGVPATEFGEDGHLGQMHCTSKLASSELLGRYGRFLSHLGVLSILTISSSTAGHMPECSLTFHRGKVISRTLHEAKEHGASKTSYRTSVVVRNLFGDMPVRMKQRVARFQDNTEIEKAFQGLKLSIISYLLSCKDCPTLRMTEKGSKLRYRYSNLGHQPNSFPTITSVYSVLVSAGVIDQGDVRSWKTASLRTSDISLKAFISLQPSPSKRCQFISIGQRPIQNCYNSNILFQAINRQFEMSTFSASEQTTRSRGVDRVDGSINRRHRTLDDGRGRRVDKWPMFYIRFDSSIGDISTYMDSETAGASDDYKKTHHIDQILNLVKSLVKEFLQTYHFRPRARGTRANDEVLPIRARSNGPTPAMAAPQAASTSSRGLYADFFTRWSRIKASNSATISTLLECLPKRGNGSPDDHCEGLTDAELLSFIAQVDDDCSQKRALDIQPKEESGGNPVDGVEGHASADHEGFIRWRDPATRTDVLIDVRTGQSIPKHLLSSKSPAILAAEPESVPKSQRQKQTRRGIYSRTTPSDSVRIAAFLEEASTSHFRKGEEPIPSISLIDDDSSHARPLSRSVPSPPICQQDSCAQDTDSGFSDKRLTKTALQDAMVLGQVDQKFIVVRTNDTLVLIDQHAADERVKVEALYQSLCNSRAIPLSKSIVVEVSHEETTLLRKAQTYFASWGIIYEIRGIGSKQKIPARNRPASNGYIHNRL